MQHLLLAACMHNGFQVLTLDATRSISSAAHYAEHQSLAYGVDWWCDRTSLCAPQPIFASCSFYDHAFHVWQHSVPVPDLHLPDPVPAPGSQDATHF